jgi:hypothetical protein
MAKEPTAGLVIRSLADGECISIHSLMEKFLALYPENEKPNKEKTEILKKRAWASIVSACRDNILKNLGKRDDGNISFYMKISQDKTGKTSTKPKTPVVTKLKKAKKPQSEAIQPATKKETVFTRINMVNHELYELIKTAEQENKKTLRQLSEKSQQEEKIITAKNVEIDYLKKELTGLRARIVDLKRDLKKSKEDLLAQEEMHKEEISRHKKELKCKPATIEEIQRVLEQKLPKITKPEGQVPLSKSSKCANRQGLPKISKYFNNFTVDYTDNVEKFVRHLNPDRLEVIKEALWKFFNNGARENNFNIIPLLPNMHRQSYSLTGSERCTAFVERNNSKIEIYIDHKLEEGEKRIIVSQLKFL